MILLICLLPLAFLCGSLPTALLMGRAQGIDIRRHGSGNVGATNAFRVLGRKFGAMCLLVDALKGFLPVQLMLLAYNLSETDALTTHGWMWLAGLAAIAGHMFSPFLRFRGGKGVATSLGVMLAIVPLALFIVLMVAALLIWVTGYVSLASIVGAFLLPVLLILLNVQGHIPWVSVGVTAALGGVIVFKHRSNIARLKAGTESRIFDRLADRLEAKQGEESNQ